MGLASVGRAPIWLGVQSPLLAWLFIAHLQAVRGAVSSVRVQTQPCSSSKEREPSRAPFSPDSSNSQTNYTLWNEAMLGMRSKTEQHSPEIQDHYLSVKRTLKACMY